MLETDHQSYVNCICGTTVSEQPFDNIWNVLMILLHHFEDMFRIYAPSKILLIEIIKKESILTFVKIINFIVLFNVHIVMNIHLW